MRGLDTKFMENQCCEESRQGLENPQHQDKLIFSSHFPLTFWRPRDCDFKYCANQDNVVLF